MRNQKLLIAMSMFSMGFGTQAQPRENRIITSERPSTDAQNRAIIDAQLKRARRLKRNLMLNKNRPSDVILKPKTPDHLDWTYVTHTYNNGFYAEYWESVAGHLAISAVEVVTDDDHEPPGPEYHVSFSKDGGRVPADEMARLLKIFGMQGATEDNHVEGGIARHYWMPVKALLIGIECPCKTTETVVVEGDYEYRPI